jgi:hypothetical protein
MKFIVRQSDGAEKKVIDLYGFVGTKNYLFEYLFLNGLTKKNKFSA